MILFRCEASHSSGFGHLKRCMILAHSLETFTDISFVVTETDIVAKSILEKNNLKFIQIPDLQSYSDEITFYKNAEKKIIVDLCTMYNLQNPEKLIAYMAALKKADYRIATLNGIGGDAFHHPETPEVDIYMQPYWGTEAEPKPKAKHWLHGPQYTLIDDEYKNAFVDKKLSYPPRKILVTFGGADPQGNSVRLAQALSKICGESQEIKARIILGQFFDGDHISEIQNLTKRTGKIETVYGKTSLLPYYQWADLCICGSGMTRYEASACGLPSLSTAIYKEHIDLSKSFASFGTSCYVGFCEELSVNDWVDAISSIRHNRNYYEEMISALASIKDFSEGSRKLACEIFRIFSNEKRDHH